LVTEEIEINMQRVKQYEKETQKQVAVMKSLEEENRQRKEHELKQKLDHSQKVLNKIDQLCQDNGLALKQF
jgi:hypothetical protein